MLLVCPMGGMRTWDMAIRYALAFSAPAGSVDITISCTVYTTRLSAASTTDHPLLIDRRGVPFMTWYFGVSYLGERIYKLKLSIRIKLQSNYQLR
jgi:hypothetical protein